MRARRVELTVRYVMSNVVPCDEEKSFLFWLRFEWGSNGNPHAHGQAYVKYAPSFEHVVSDAEFRDSLIRDGYPQAAALQTQDEAGQDLEDFFNRYVKELHV